MICTKLFLKSELKKIIRCQDKDFYQAIKKFNQNVMQNLVQIVQKNKEHLVSVLDQFIRELEF